jgi:hypothetical protein
MMVWKKGRKLVLLFVQEPPDRDDTLLSTTSIIVTNMLHEDMDLTGSKINGNVR